MFSAPSTMLQLSTRLPPATSQPRALTALLRAAAIACMCVIAACIPSAHASARSLSQIPSQPFQDGKNIYTTVSIDVPAWTRVPPSPHGIGLNPISQICVVPSLGGRIFQCSVHIKWPHVSGVALEKTVSVPCCDNAAGFVQVYHQKHVFASDWGGVAEFRWTGIDIPSGSVSTETLWANGGSTSNAYGGSAPRIRMQMSLPVEEF